MEGTPLNEIQVRAHLEWTLLDRQKKLAKRCERIGVAAPTVEVTRRWVEKKLDDLGQEIFTSYIAYIVEGKTPKLAGGWQIVSAIEHNPTGNIVKTNPKFIDSTPTNLLTVEATCDHCNRKRDRKTTIIVQDENGVQTRVGTACLKDFTGHNLPAVWDLFDENLSEWDDETLSHREYPHTMTKVVAHAVASVRQYGWKKASAEFGIPTSDRVLSSLSNRAWGDQVDVTPEDFVKANDALMWIASTTETEGYLANLRSAVLADSIQKNFNLIVSLPQAYERFLNPPAPREVQPELPKTLVMTGKVTIKGKVLKVNTKEYAQFTRVVMTVLDDRGFKVWGSVPAKISDLKQGDTVQFDATVEKSPEDESFGFYSRPTKAQLLTVS